MVVKLINSVEEALDEKQHPLFLAAANVFFNGDIEAAIKSYNETQIKFEEIEQRSPKIKNPPKDMSYIRLKSTH